MATCTGHAVVPCGNASISTCNLPGVASAVERLADAKQQEAKKGERGQFQRTPAFIHGLVCSVLGSGLGDARGGFTDVGEHTGGVARSTAWPLVRAVLEVGTYEQHDCLG